MIELRWIEREVEFQSGDIATAWKERFLQYRTVEDSTFVGGGINWTEWKDVPLVKEPARGSVEETTREP